MFFLIARALHVCRNIGAFFCFCSAAQKRASHAPPSTDHNASARLGVCIGGYTRRLHTVANNNTVHEKEGGVHECGITQQQSFGQKQKNQPALAMSGKGKGKQQMTPVVDKSKAGDVNLAVLRRIDPEVEQILANAGHVCLYRMNVGEQQWVS